MNDSFIIEDIKKIIQILSRQDVSALTFDGYRKKEFFISALHKEKAKVFIIEANNFSAECSYSRINVKNEIGYATDNQICYISDFVNKIRGIYEKKSYKPNTQIVFITINHMMKIFLDFIKYYLEQKRINFNLCDVIVLTEKNDVLISLWKYLYDLKINVPRLVVFNSERISTFTFYECNKQTYNVNVEYNNKNFKIGSIKMYDELISVILRKHNSDSDFINNNKSDTWLVICPSSNEVDYISHSLRQMGDKSLSVVSFNTDSSKTDKNKVFSETLKCVRKIIIASNNVEQSINIYNISIVFDTMLEKQVIKSLSGGTKIGLSYISKKNADNRKDKTGINCCGTIYRMCTEDFYNSLEEKNKQENINNLIIKLAKVNVDITQILPNIVCNDNIRLLNQLHILNQRDKNVYWISKINKNKYLYEDDDFFVIEDRKHKSENIHLLTIVKDRNIETIADLKIKDVPLLEKMKEQTLQLIGNKKIYMYFHYPPSTYILHMHFTSMLDDRYPYYTYDDVINSLVNNVKLVYKIPNYYVGEMGNFVSVFNLSPRNSLMLYKFMKEKLPLFPFVSLICIIDSYSGDFFHYPKGVNKDEYLVENFSEFNHSSDLGIIMNVWLKFIKKYKTIDIRYEKITEFSNENSLNNRKFSDFFGSLKQVLSTLNYMKIDAETGLFDVDRVIDKSLNFIIESYNDCVYTKDADGKYNGYELDENLSLNDMGNKIVSLIRDDNVIKLSLKI